MPPKRRPPTVTAPKTTGARLSKLAKEHNITAQEEAEIREAFSLFSEPMEGEKDGVMPISDVRRALVALNLPPTTPSQLSTFLTTLDPTSEGFTTLPSFLAICALQLHTKRDNETDEAHQAELDEAYALFAGGDPDAPAITLAQLKRVAGLLRLDGGGDGDGDIGEGGKKGKGKKGGWSGEVVVTEEVLRDMILEANGGAGVGKGVRKEEFDGVMRRAGVWR